MKLLAVRDENARPFCAHKDETVAHYALEGLPNKVMASEYRLALPTEELLLSLGRPDVFPHDDLGVRTAIRDRYRLTDLPDKKTSHAIAAPWRPFASVASWYCWRTLDLARNSETVATGYPS